MLLARLFTRGLEVLILGFALYGFAGVKLGDRTALEHLAAMLSTPEAAHAGRELRGASARSVKRLRAELTRMPRPVHGRPEVPRFGAADAASRP